MKGRLSSESALVNRVLVLVAVAACSAYVAIYALGLAGDPARSDGFCYYVYLPSWVHYHDTSLRSVADQRFGGDYPAWLQISWRPGTGRWLNAHQAGVAVMCLPFYLAGHLLTSASGGAQDGFSFFERHSAGVAGIAYLVIGLWVLGRVLLRDFSETVVAVTLICLTFGTNLFHYATYDSLWSHVFSFCLFACALWAADEWFRDARWPAAIALGGLAGMICLVRQSDVLFLAVVMLLGITDLRSVRERAEYLARHRAQVAVMVALAAAVYLPQFLLFKAASGEWWANPYAPFLKRAGVRQAFVFSSPHVLDVLFSPQKGLFFWSPVLALSVVGLCLRDSPSRRYTAGILVFLALQAYLTGSWNDWQMGGSFGQRAFTEGLAALAIPMAATFRRVSNAPRWRIPTAAFASACVGLSLFQMMQYWTGVLRSSNTSWAEYVHLFMRLHR